MPVLFLLITLLTPLSDQPQAGRRSTMPDYFGNGQSGGGQSGGAPALRQCNLQSQSASGRFKTCRYDCGRSLTVGDRSVCPFVLNR